MCFREDTQMNAHVNIMGQFHAVPRGNANLEKHIIEVFDSVWECLEDDVKSLVLHHLMSREPHRFQSPPAYTLVTPSPERSGSALLTKSGQAPSQESPAALSITLTPLPTAVKLHFAKCRHDPGQFFGRPDNVDTPLNLAKCQVYLALVHSRNTDWLGHVQLRFLTVGFYELELHVRRRCQKRHPSRWVKQRLVQLAQVCQPERAKDEVETEVANFLSWGRRYHQFMSELSTAAVARLRPHNRTE